MRCPKCSSLETKVADTRPAHNQRAIRRRRQCLDCGYRFTTIEEILREGLVVTKRDGRREEFDRNKIINGIRKAIDKRPVDAEQVEFMIADLLDELEQEYDLELPSAAIGEAIMRRLKKMDKIAYVRFASIYKDFRDVDELAAEIEALNLPQHDEAGQR